MIKWYTWGHIWEVRLLQRTRIHVHYSPFTSKNFFHLGKEKLNCSDKFLHHNYSTADLFGLAIVVNKLEINNPVVSQSLLCFPTGAGQYWAGPTRDLNWPTGISLCRPGRVGGFWWREVMAKFRTAGTYSRQQGIICTDSCSWLQSISDTWTIQESANTLFGHQSSNVQPDMN